jgi:serine/alanine adding enzyme
MGIIVREMLQSDADAWDEYVYAHPQSTLYHLSRWRTVIGNTYRQRDRYLVALENSRALPGTSLNRVCGVLPLVHVKHFLFGQKLVSLPYFDMGGILADDETTEKLLCARAVEIARTVGVPSLEFRHPYEVSWAGEGIPAGRSGQSPVSVLVRSHKTRMLLRLPGSSDELMNSFKSKLRSQIRRPMKEALNARVGGLELLDDFYRVFCENMRDLGSPVHSKRLMKEVLTQFTESARLVVIYHADRPIAGSMVVGFRDVLENPWASAIRSYSRLSPNMLLYWTMLEYACDNGFTWFDFGRSSPGEGTYGFKKQWGAQPEPLHWLCFGLEGKDEDELSFEKTKFKMAVRLWQRLPVFATLFLGPWVRKGIDL